MPAVYLASPAFAYRSHIATDAFPPSSRLWKIACSRAVSPSLIMTLVFAAVRFSRRELADRASFALKSWPRASAV